jgi:uncharacterized lipoprotein YmbA
MKSPASSLRLTLIGTIGVLLAGCLFKATTVTTRSFLLTPIPAAEAGPAAAGHLPVGVGLVKMPPYLMKTSMAFRKGPNEVGYLPNAFWAERLDQSFQRTLAANLAALIPTDRIRLSEWPRQEVALAVHVSVSQFDVDAEGRGALVAWWRLTAPGGDTVLKSGESRLNRAGPAPEADPQAMAATLSELAAELSRAVAQAIRESSPPRSTGR